MSRSTWFKSTYSDDGGGCVEVASVDLAGVRDSTDPEGPVLWFTLGEWATFLTGARAGEYDFS